ncbi:hypothetical protein WJX84_006861 [Apatococcus fuscideae]|uniref:Uncharacterized protein n=1 Tax=Apatococcus fuscideae TaxID=2026836 RepID=A0AAW1RLM4_9CHLO
MVLRRIDPPAATGVRSTSGTHFQGFSDPYALQPASSLDSYGLVSLPLTADGPAYKASLALVKPSRISMANPGVNHPFQLNAGTDASAAEKAFASLVIIVPSQYKGGQMELLADGEGSTAAIYDAAPYNTVATCCFAFRQGMTSAIQHCASLLRRGRTLQRGMSSFHRCLRAACKGSLR